MEEGGSVQGLGLIDMDTVFGKEKHTVQVSGCFGRIEGIFAGLSGKEYKGYEIHMGQPADDKMDNSCINIQACKSNIYGSYVHGLFNNTDIAYIIVKALAYKKGADISNINNFDYSSYKEKQYDILAEAIRENVDIGKIYNIMGIK